MGDGGGDDGLEPVRNFIDAAGDNTARIHGQRDDAQEALDAEMNAKRNSEPMIDDLRRDYDERIAHWTGELNRLNAELYAENQRVNEHGANTNMRNAYVNQTNAARASTPPPGIQRPPVHDPGAPRRPDRRPPPGGGGGAARRGLF